MSNYKKERLTEQNIRRTGIVHALREITPRPFTEDSKNRRAIQQFILEKCLQLNSEEEIMSLLNNEFADSKFDIYRPYFRTWVHDRLKYKKISKTQSDKEER